METLDKPRLVPLTSGETVKVFQVTGQAGMQMPLHYSTREAVVIVQEGSAVLTMDEKEHVLQPGNVLVIPARRNHCLYLTTGFQALVLMPIDSNIEFVGQ